MNVLVSMVSQKNSRVYHRKNCIYERRILPQNRMSISIQQARGNRYRACKCCKGLAGEVAAKKKSLAAWARQYNMVIQYLRACDTLYIQTANGFWKIFQSIHEDKFVLYHLNKNDKQQSFYESTHGDFHRQSDVKPMWEIDGLIKYIHDHDKAKSIIMDDYRKLPRSTKRQRKYYKQAKNKAKKESWRRVEALFAQLESNATK